jgi:hypothetical protein
LWGVVGGPASLLTTPFLTLFAERDRTDSSDAPEQEKEPRIIRITRMRKIKVANQYRVWISSCFYSCHLAPKSALLAQISEPLNTSLIVADHRESSHGYGRANLSSLEEKMARLYHQ